MGGKLGSEPETLQDLLDDEAIALYEAPRPGGKDHGGARSKLFCPACQGGKSKERNFFVKIDPDGFGFRYVCHRASCGITGGRRLKGKASLGPSAWAPKVYRRPEPPQEIHRPDSLVSYFAGFGISAATLNAFGIHRGERHMPVLDHDGVQVKGEVRRRPVICYPYRENGALLNVKYKAVYTSGKKRFMQERDAEPSLYNIDSFTTGDAGYFVEGEDDCLAMFEAGFRQVTTVVDGAPDRLGADYDPATDDDKRYLAVVGDPKLAACKRIYLAGDMDKAGQIHHEEIARRVGKAKCWIVRWPEGCKDAKDTLAQRGAAAVRHAVDVATQYPLDGIEIVSDEAIGALYDGDANRRFITGYEAIDTRISLREDGSFIVCTGIPGHGKSAYFTATAMLYVNHAIDLGRANMLIRPFHVVMFGAEQSNARLSADLVSAHTNRPFFSNADHTRLSRAEAIEINATWVRRHFTFVHWPDRATQPTMSWVIGRVREVVTRTGAPMVVIDPVQEIDDEMPQSWRRPHSDWVGVMLQRLVGLAHELRTNIVLIAHPSKPAQRNKDGSYPIPGGYDIGGSQNYYSRCDIGLTIHRPDFKSDDMLLRCWKTKDKRFANVGDTTLRFDARTARVWPRPVEVDAFGEPMPRSFHEPYADAVND